MFSEESTDTLFVQSGYTAAISLVITSVETLSTLWAVQTVNNVETILRLTFTTLPTTYASSYTWRVPSDLAQIKFYANNTNSQQASWTVQVTQCGCQNGARCLYLKTWVSDKYLLYNLRPYFVQIYKTIHLPTVH